MPPLLAGRAEEKAQKKLATLILPTHSSLYVIDWPFS